MSRFTYPRGCFHIEPTPSQPQIAHCHGFFVPVALRRNRYGHWLKAQQMIELARLHYDYATATVDSKNEAQIIVLIDAGWKRLDSFKNSKTGGTTELWGWAVTKD